VTSNKTNYLPQQILERLLASFADAYAATADDCKGILWQSVLAELDMIASGRVSGQLVLGAEFSTQISATHTGVKITPLRVNNVLVDLRSEYADLVEKFEKGSET